MSLERTTLNQRYRLLSRISAGKIADVWDAYDDQLSRPVAIKIANENNRASSEVIKAFRDEASIAAKLSHRNVVETYDAGVDLIDNKTTPYIVMERVYGKTLREAMRSHPFSELEIRRIGEQLCWAVDYINSQGLTHNDIKPTNILVSGNPAYRDSRVVVTDFELASKMSETGVVHKRGGTAAYIAPELIVGAPANAHTDMYSIGAVLYELAANTPPILEETEQATLEAKKSRDAIAVRAVQPNLSEDLSRTIDICVSRDPSQRFETINDLRHLLAESPDLPLAGVHASTIDDNATTPPYGTPTKHVLSKKSRKPLVIFSFFSIFAVLLAAGITRFGGLASFNNGQSDQSKQVAIVSLHSFDPQGDQQENDAEIPHLDDNNPATVWSTSRYNSHSFGGLKKGVGVAIEMTRSRISKINFSGVTTGISLEIYASNQTQTSLEGWGKPIAKGPINSDPASIQFPSLKTTDILIWITDLGPANKASIGEVQIFG